MFSHFVVPFLVLQALAFASPTVHTLENGVAITSLEKNGTSTNGSGNVAAAGTLSPFGDIGIGKFL
jgi:hypothetical protein